MADAGVTYSGTVQADSVVSEMEMEELARVFEDTGYSQYVTSDLSDARQWMADQPSSR